MPDDNVAFTNLTDAEIKRARTIAGQFLEVIEEDGTPAVVAFAAVNLLAGGLYGACVPPETRIEEFDKSVAFVRKQLMETLG